MIGLYVFIVWSIISYFFTVIVYTSLQFTVVDFIVFLLLISLIIGLMFTVKSYDFSFNKYKFKSTMKLDVFNTIKDKAEDLNNTTFVSIAITGIAIGVSFFFNPIISIILYSCSLLFSVIITKRKTKEIIDFWNKETENDSEYGKYNHKKLFPALKYIVSLYRDIGIVGGIGVVIIKTFAIICIIATRIFNMNFYSSILKKANHSNGDN